MNHRIRSIVLASAAAGLAACTAADRTVTAADAGRPRFNGGPVCVEFGPPVPALNTLYGSSVGTPPGVTQWVENGIPVAFYPFALSNGGSAYNTFRVEAASALFGVGQIGHSININAGFSFGGIGSPTKVTFEWLAATTSTGSGYQNLSINGSPTWIGNLASPPALLGGTSVSSVTSGTSLGVRGTTTIIGKTGGLKVGGTNLFIDRVCATV